MDDALIFKVRITEEAKFDFEETLGGDMSAVTPFGTTIKNDIKQQVEEFMLWTNKYRHKPYFKVPYINEIDGERLLLFFRQKERYACMQIIELVGITYENDWDEELEECGQVKVWLDSKIDLTDVPFDDWVEIERERKAEEERQQKIDEEERKDYERRNA